MRSLALLVALAVTAGAQSLPYSFKKSSDPTKPDAIDATSLQENLEFLFNQVHQQKVTTNGLVVNGVVTTVTGSSPICSSGGNAPNITFCGTIPESKVVNLVSDLSTINSLIAADFAAFNAYVATTSVVVYNLGASTASIASGGATTYLHVDGSNYMTGQLTVASSATIQQNEDVNSLSVQNLPMIAVATAAPVFSSDLIDINGAGNVGFYNSGNVVVAGGSLIASVGGSLTGSLPNPTITPTGWIAPGPISGSVGAANECDQSVYGQDGRIISATTGQLCVLSESQVTNLTSDLSAKYPTTGGTINGNVHVAGNLLVDDVATLYTVNTTTGVNIGPGNVPPTGINSAVAGTLTVGNSTWIGGVSALNGGSEFKGVTVYDPVIGATQTIRSTGGARFGCTGGIFDGCGVQTIDGNGKIPQFDSTHFSSLDISAATGTPSFLSSYLPLAGGTMTGALQMSNHLNFASSVSNINFIDDYYHSLIFKSTGSPRGWPIGEIEWIQGGTGIHRIISFDAWDTGGKYPGMLVLGADQTTSEAKGNRGVVINGNEIVTPDLYVSTYAWVSVGTTSPTANGSTAGLYVGGNIVSTGTVSGYFLPTQMTVSQAQAATAVQGEVIMCTNCTRPYTILVGTGTAVDQWREQGYSTGAQ